MHQKAACNALYILNTDYSLVDGYENFKLISGYATPIPPTLVFCVFRSSATNIHMRMYVFEQKKQTVSAEQKESEVVTTKGGKRGVLLEKPGEIVEGKK